MWRKVVKMENSRSIKSVKSVTAIWQGRTGFGCRASVKEPTTTWPYALDAEGRTSSPGRGSGPRGLRTARVTAECWQGLLARGVPRGMLPAGVDGARSAPTRARDLHPSDPPPSRRCISGAALSRRPRRRAGFKQLHDGLIYRSAPTAVQRENGKIIP